jgi:hypothetical protein
MNQFITKEALQELQKTLIPVGQKLGQGGQFVWETYYRQQMVIAVQEVLYSAFALAMLGTAVWWGRFSYKKVKADIYSDFAFLSLMGVLMLLFFGVIVLVINAPGAIGHFLNPNYYIIQDLLSIIKH